MRLSKKLTFPDKTYLNRRIFYVRVSTYDQVSILSRKKYKVPSGLIEPPHFLHDRLLSFKLYIL